ncbi:MAG: ATP synthase F1 subunit delta [Clostridia bacterium]|nr:ATP synthase F1 subunit delta [Clostridia bacterium]
MRATSKEYAAALFSLARETRSEKETLEELRFIESVFEDAPDYAAFLAAPAIPKSERLGSLQQAFENSLSEYVMSFLSLLCEQGGAPILGECAAEYERLYNQSAGLARAEVVSAVALSDDQKQRLRAKLEKLSGRKLNIRWKTDPSLLGGVTVDIEGLRIDGSLRTKLKNVRKVIGE